MSDLPSTQDELVARMLGGRQVLEVTLSRVAAQQMEAPLLHDGWSVKDMLGHLGYWEAQIVARFATLQAGKQPEPVTELDAVNAQALSAWRRLSLAEVRHREQDAYERLLDLARQASSDELFGPGHFPGGDQNPFVLSIANNTWEHYAEHLPELSAWLDSGVHS